MAFSKENPWLLSLGVINLFVSTAYDNIIPSNYHKKIYFCQKLKFHFVTWQVNVSVCGHYCEKVSNGSKGDPNTLLICLQTERAYQKQPSIFQNKKRVLAQPGKKKELRYVRNVGLGFKTPKEVLHSIVPPFFPQIACL